MSAAMKHGFTPRPISQLAGGAVTYRIEQPHPTTGELSVWYSDIEPQASEYASIGWTVTPLYAGGHVTQAWTHRIPKMQQTVLLTAIRGPDGLPKYGAIKMLLRWFRRCVLLSAIDGRVLDNPVDQNGGSFTGPSLEGDDDLDPWSDRMQVHVNDYLRQLDQVPHHFQMHFMHAVEIVGYKHPNAETRHFWHQLYVRLVHDMHLWPETEQQLDERLGDSRSGWLKRADPATVE